MLYVKFLGYFEFSKILFSLLMGIPIPHTLVQTSKISLIRVRSLVQLTLKICMNLLLHTAMISRIFEMMRTLLSIGSGSLTNLPKQKINNIFGGYTPKPLWNQQHRYWISKSRTGVIDCN